MLNSTRTIGSALAIAALVAGLATMPAEAKRHHTNYARTYSRSYARYLGYGYRYGYQPPSVAVPQTNPYDPNFSSAQQSIANTYNSIPTEEGKRAYMEQLSRQHWLGGQGGYTPPVNPYPYGYPY